MDSKNLRNAVLSQLSKSLIEKFESIKGYLGIEHIQELQKIITDQGLIDIQAYGRDPDAQKLVIYSEDTKANETDISAIDEVIALSGIVAVDTCGPPNATFSCTEGSTMNDCLSYVPYCSWAEWGGPDTGINELLGDDNITNGGCETWSDASTLGSWNHSQGVAARQSGARTGGSGTYYADFIDTSSGGSTFKTSAFTSTSGKNYKLEFWYKSDTLSTDASVHDGSSFLLDYVVLPSTAGVWTKSTHYFTGSGNAYTQARFRAGTAGATFSIDDVSIKEIADGYCETPSDNYCTSITTGNTQQLCEYFGCTWGIEGQADYLSIDVGGDGSVNITMHDNIIAPDIQETNSPYHKILDNISQFIRINTDIETIDPIKAKEVLKDKRIHELIQIQETRQERIDTFFNLYNDIKPKENQDLIESSISQNPEDPTASLTWKTEFENAANSNKSLEWMKGDLQKFFAEEAFSPIGDDQRPVYENKSSGFLKIRDLNHAIIIKNIKHHDLGIENWQEKGFTITMWVKFLNRKITGTLFNYGNPLMKQKSNGFILESTPINNKRIIRLVLIDKDGKLRDSHYGTHSNVKIDITSMTNDPQSYKTWETSLVYHHEVLKMREWYFICATYDPFVDEDSSYTMRSENYEGISDFWRGNFLQGQYTSYSGYGNKCKVEIISRSELIRARGFRI